MHHVPGTLLQQGSIEISTIKKVIMIDDILECLRIAGRG
jgi:hypothetical protein